jgi:hypothetical protein
MGNRNTHRGDVYSLPHLIGPGVALIEAAFGATVLHRVGEGDDIVAQLAVDGAAFWVAAADSARRRCRSPGGRRRADVAGQLMSPVS